MLQPLKVKVVNLADEAKYIRSLERKEKQKFNLLNIRKRLADGNLTPKQIERLARKCRRAAAGNSPKQTRTRERKVGFNKINPKDGYVYETLIEGDVRIDMVSLDYSEYELNNHITPPDPQWIQGHYNMFMDLKNHRTGVVRTESRSAQLALAFFRGRPYESVETHPYEKRWANVSQTTGTNAPNWKRIREIVQKFWRYSSFQSQEEALVAFDAWRPWSAWERRTYSS